MLSDANWAKPLRWNRDAEAAGIPARVFCASMADVFEDHPQVIDARARLWDLIEATPWLHWQLLTKRIENVASMAPWGATWPPNVGLGTSVENQWYAGERIPVLASIPARIRFLSCEPLLGPVDLSRWLARGQLSWVITGGESGGRRREMDIGWLTSLAGQCQAAGVPVHVKQDSGQRSGLQGRNPDKTWALRQFPAAPGALQDGPHEHDRPDLPGARAARRGPETLGRHAPARPGSGHLDPATETECTAERPNRRRCRCGAAGDRRPEAPLDAPSLQ
jgi:protein gp37